MPEHEPTLSTNFILELADILQEEYEYQKHATYESNEGEIEQLAQQIFDLVKGRSSTVDQVLFKNQCPYVD